MNSTDHDLLKVAVFSNDECEAIKTLVAEFHEARWFHRDKINSLPTDSDGSASYDFCGDRQQPTAFNHLLRHIAPVIEGTELAEVVINRYRIGDYMPQHIDRSPYRFNMVIALNEDQGGLFVKDQWHMDVMGQATIFTAKSPPHHVPMVTKERFVLIYLYE